MASGSLGDGQWIVPITLCCGSYDVHKNFLLQTKSETLDMKELRSDGSNLASSWVKLNVNQTGFYRVKYDEDLAAKLRYAIENKYLSATDRFGNFDICTHFCYYRMMVCIYGRKEHLTQPICLTGILDDSFALCMARQKSLNSLLILMGAYNGELEYTVLSNLINVMFTSCLRLSIFQIFSCALSPSSDPNSQISYKVERIAADANPELLECIKQFFIYLFRRSAM